MDDDGAGPRSQSRLLCWLAAIACGVAILAAVASATFDRVLASPAGTGWDKPALIAATAEACRLGWLHRLLTDDHRGGDDSCDERECE